MKQHLHLARVLVPLVVAPIAFITQGASLPIPVFIAMIAVAGFSIAGVLTSSAVPWRGRRAGRSDAITADVAARGRSVADDLLAARPTTR